MDAYLEQAKAIWGQAYGIWVAGGPAMLAIAADAFALFALGVHVFLKLRRTGFRSVPEKTWRRWIKQPQERQGHVGEILNQVTGARTIEEAAIRFKSVELVNVAPFERDLRVMRICVSTAPLLGLFGTVTGMLATFGALASGTGGEKTMGMIAKGISEALITTETGLVIALPGLFFQYQLARTLQGYKAFLAHLQTACSLELFHRGREQEAAA